MVERSSATQARSRADVLSPSSTETMDRSETPSSKPFGEPTRPQMDSIAAEEIVARMAEMHEWFQQRWPAFQTAYETLQAEVKRLNEEIARKNAVLEAKNRQLEASLLEQERLHHSLRSIVNSLHHGVIAVDPNGRISLFNRRAADLTRKQEEEVLGRQYSEVFPEHPPILLETLKSARPDVREFENYLGRATKPRQIEVTTALVRDDQEVVHGAVEVLRDLTEWREMQAQLERAKMLAALGEVSVTIAHEIRNPLGAIQLFVEMLNDGELPPAERRKVLDNIFNAIKLMNTTISNLLQFTRPVMISERFQNLSPLLDQSLQLAEHALRVENVQVERDYPAVGLMCHVDDAQFVKAMLNLLLNAIQATEGKDERSVTLRARRWEGTLDDPPGAEMFGGTPWIEVEVTDNGCGIAPDMLEQIFTPFVTTKVNGVGLGLPIVHNVIDAHGGQITVDSVVDRGTCVRLMLPVYRPETTRDASDGEGATRRPAD